MVFSSLNFLLIFLPIVLLLHSVLPFKYKNIVLLAASIIFYAWGEPVYVILMILSIGFNYMSGLVLGELEDPHMRKRQLIFAVAVNLLLLGFFKYAGFLVSMINTILPLKIEFRALALPVGISFYTFQALSYVIDVYRKKVKPQENPLNFAVYITMFPQLVAGPIVKYSDIELQLSNRRISRAKFGQGIERLLFGLSKKVLLANNLGLLYETIQASGSRSIMTSWLGIFAYTLQIYFDFSGYSDMAIGMGKMLGFTFPENFNFPYISDSITEFWRRWHMTLSGWFREYVYIPLGGNRVSKPRHILSLLIVWVGGHQIAQSTMQVGDMMAFIQYAMQVIMSFLFISMMFVMVPRASVSAERVHEVLATQPSVRDKEQPRHLPQPVRGVVEFRDVSFRHGGADEPVLHHVSFTAKPGQTTAFIGSTGSGKSTLVNLIPRFYDVSEGSILLDGIDVRDIPQKELRAAIGYVPQKGMLFSGSIASNLRYGDEEASEKKLRTACDVAQATEFVSGLPEGLDTYVSQGGTSVSGGQRQRLSIARALVKKAPVYIFDDTFSALDFKTDARLRGALAGYTNGATVLIVAQRVSTIMNAEQIIVLDEGKIVGKGTHKELLKTCPEYREIAESQLSKEELA